MKTSEINIKVVTDINHLPELITWQASDSGMDGENDTKAMMLAFWDSQQQNTLKIDLWTKDMMVEEMKLFFYQTILSMSATLERATNDSSAAADMREFCKHLAQKMEIETTPPKS
jgi:gliding motility-associated protein GldC